MKSQWCGPENMEKHKGDNDCIAKLSDAKIKLKHSINLTREDSGKSRDQTEGDRRSQLPSGTKECKGRMPSSKGL